MSVVSNASPLIGLARIGELELLQQLYGELVIPEAVEHEVVVEGAELPAADQVGKAAWIKTRIVSNNIITVPSPLQLPTLSDPDIQ